MEFFFFLSYDLIWKQGCFIPSIIESDCKYIEEELHFGFFTEHQTCCQGAFKEKYQGKYYFHREKCAKKKLFV